MFNSHFSTKTVKALARKGIRIVGLTMVGDDTGYCLDNNGQHQICLFLEVLALAE